MPTVCRKEWHSPKQFATLYIKADQALDSKSNHLFGFISCDSSHDRRRVARAIVLRFPEHGAAALVKTYDASALGVADKRNQLLVFNPRRTGVSMAVRALHHATFRRKVRMEILGETGAPLESAIGDRETTQFTFAGQRINPVAIHEWRAARSRRTLKVLKRIINGRPPEFATGVAFERVENFFILLGIQVEDFFARHDRRGEAISHLDSPDGSQLARERLGAGAAWRNMAVTLWAAPARPIGGETICSQQDQARHKWSDGETCERARKFSNSASHDAINSSRHIRKRTTPVSSPPMGL